MRPVHAFSICELVTVDGYGIPFGYCIPFFPFFSHTRAWLPTTVPILSSADGEELPIDGRWQMEMIDYSLTDL